MCVCAAVRLSRLLPLTSLIWTMLAVSAVTLPDVESKPGFLCGWRGQFSRMPSAAMCSPSGLLRVSWRGDEAGDGRARVRDLEVLPLDPALQCRRSPLRGWLGGPERRPTLSHVIARTRDCGHAAHKSWLPYIKSASSPWRAGLTVAIRPLLSEVDLGAFLVCNLLGLFSFNEA